MNSAQLHQQNPLNQPQTTEPPADNIQSAYQPQPIVMPNQAAKKMDARTISMIALSVVVLAGAVFGAMTLTGKNSAESKAGLTYIKALHTKDAASIEAVSDPAVVKLGDKIGKLGGAQAKDDFYKSYATASSKQSGSSAGSEIKELKVTKKATDGVKYAYVTYQADAPTTVLESYQNSQPKVIAAQIGINSYDAAQFKTIYQTYQNQMNQMGRMVDQIAQGAGNNSQQVIQSLFTIK